jgi:hypothetical protein
VGTAHTILDELLERLRDCLTVEVSEPLSGREEAPRPSAVLREARGRAEQELELLLAALDRPEDALIDGCPG